MTVSEMIKKLEDIAEALGGDYEVTALVEAQRDEGYMYETRRIQVEDREYVRKADGCVLIID